MDATAARERMVHTQIAARGVRDPRVLAVMREMPRHLFVQRSLRDEAYEDRPLPIGESQTISQPYMVAIMTATLNPAPEDHVLEIGTGSGYQTAILARLARSVVSVERLPALSVKAAAVLAELGISNVELVVGDGSAGYSARAPYRGILVTAGAPAVPDVLADQLADGGRLVIPVGPSGFQHLTVLERKGGSLHESRGDACSFVPLIGRHAWTEPDR